MQLRGRQYISSPLTRVLFALQFSANVTFQILSETYWKLFNQAAFVLDIKFTIISRQVINFTGNVANIKRGEVTGKRGIISVIEGSYVRLKDPQQH